MNIEKPDWVRQAEEDLEVLKELPIFKLSTAQIAAASRSYQCNICGELFVSFSIKSHQKRCAKLKELEPAVLELYHNGDHLLDLHIAKKLKVSSLYVTEILRNNNLPPWRIENYEEEIIKVYHNGEKLGNPEIAKRFGLSKTAVKFLLAKHGLEPWGGSNKGPGKRTQELWDKVLPMLESGMSTSKIGLDLDIPSASVRKLARRMGYKLNTGFIEQGSIQKQKVIELHSQGKTDRQIHEETGIPKRTIQRYRKIEGLSPNKH